MPDGNRAFAIAPVVATDLLLDRVADAIRSAILDGKLAPGTRLSVPELARQLNVSRTPAREALFRLEREGLVSVTPRRGAVVLDGKPADLVELFEFREALEGMSARLAAERMTDDGKSELREAFERHAAAVRKRDLRSHMAYDARFHELFVAGARNQRIADELQRIRSQLQLLTRTMSALPGALDERVIGVHEAILTAIEQGNRRSAEAAARSHVRGILEFYQAQAE
jgi:DNA-binding GntR family transcriptional regulator